MYIQYILGTEGPQDKGPKIGVRGSNFRLQGPEYCAALLFISGSERIISCSQQQIMTTPPQLLVFMEHGLNIGFLQVTWTLIPLPLLGVVILHIKDTRHEVKYSPPKKTSMHYRSGQKCGFPKLWVPSSCGSLK